MGRKALRHPDGSRRLLPPLRPLPAPGKAGRRMTSRPTVLISGSTEKKGIELSDRSASLGLSYPLALKAAGAMPLLLPCLPDKEFIADAVRRCEGVLLT